MAQSGGITVRVVDPEGNPLPGASVTISHATGSVATTTEQSDAAGLVNFPVLRPGAGYAIQVTFPGMSPMIERDLRIRVGDNRRLTVQMIRQLSERVKIVAERQVIDIDKTEASTKFSDGFIQDLPVPGRFYQNILTMAPGVQDADGDGNPNVHGSRNRDFKAVVSGISNVDPLTGQWMSRVNPNSIEEMEVITAGAGVEFGRAQGGFANIIQKQGSNQHEGVFEFYWRTSKFDGTGSDAISGLAPDFDWVQPSVQFSGPLIKDRLWYRFSHEYREIDEPVNVLTGIAVTTSEEATHSDQITWQVSPRNKLAFQFSADPKDTSNLGISSSIPVESAVRQKNSGETYSLTWTAPYSPKVLVESQVAWQDLNFGLFPTTRGLPNDCLTGDNFLVNSQCTNLNSGKQSGSYFETLDDRRQRLTVTGKATIYGGRFWGMSHQFKLGLGVENERYFRALEQEPSVRYEFIDPSAAALGTPDPPPPYGIALARIAVPQTDDVRATGTNWHVYAEDQFRPLPNLSIRLGARVDRTEMNAEGKLPFSPEDEFQRYIEQSQSGQAPIGVVSNAINSSYTGFEDMNSFVNQMQDILCAGVSAQTITNCRTQVTNQVVTAPNSRLLRTRRAADIAIAITNFSPYLAASWTPGSNGKTAIGFTMGRYYNSLPLVLPLQELEPLGTTLEYRVDFESNEIRNQRSIAPALDMKQLDRNLKTPYNDEFTLTFERELWPETSLELRYIRRRFEDQIQDKNINRAVNDFGKCFAQTEFFQIGPVEPVVGMSDPNDMNTWLTDVYTGERYPDTNPGPGDGRIDDCGGVLLQLDSIIPDEFGLNILRVQRPDGFPDLYMQNPFWGDIFVIGNFNSAEYEAYELVLTRRQYRNWEMNASYTYSEARGDGEDFFQVLGNDPGLRGDVYGDQSYDQRHVVKLNATAITPWGVRLGTAMTWQSGLPYSLLQETASKDSFPTLAYPSSGVGFGVQTRPRQRYVDQDGQNVARNSARNDSYWNIDLKATKELTLGGKANLQISAEVFNLLDDDTYTIYNTFNEAGQQLNGVNEAYRRFGRRWQIGMRLAY